MKATADDFEPRRDGWFEHEATWAEVVVGTVIADPRYRTKRWECIATAHGEGQVEWGKTLWMRFREQVSGEEYTSPPRAKTSPVKILTLNPADTQAGEPTEPTDTEAIMLLAQKLGAEVMATRDNVTGEVTCPDYDGTFRHHLEPGPGQGNRAFIEHLRFAHALDVPDTISAKDRTILHGQAHNPQYPDVGKGGFPHRHVPEDYTPFEQPRSKA